MMFQRLRYSLARFASGRNGTDSLYWFHFRCALALAVALLFRMPPALYWTLTALTVLSLVLALFRGFSRNLLRRRAENAAYLGLRRRLLLPFRRLSLRLRDRKTHVYRRCPSCRATLRLPRKPGKHSVTCPRCSRSFSVRVRK